MHTVSTLSNQLSHQHFISHQQTQTKHVYWEGSAHQGTGMECFYFFSVTALQLCTRSYFPTGWQLPCGQLVKTPELFFITFHDWNSLTPVPKTPGQSKVVATAAWRWGWASVGVGVDLPSAGLQVLCWPSVKTEGRAQRQQQSHQWFNGWGSLRVWSQVLEWHPVCAGGRTWGQSLLPEGREDCQFMRMSVIWCQVGSWIIRETERGACPPPPLW